MSEEQEDFGLESQEEEFGALTQEELKEIQEQYRKQKLKETLIGPIISTCVHIILILLASLFKGETKAGNANVEVTQKMEEVLEEPPPPPPPPPPPEPELETESETINPDVTETVDVTEDIATEVEEVSDEPPAAEILDDVELMSDVKPSNSPLTSAKMFSSRSPNAKANAIRKYGGSAVAQQSLRKALNWLAKNQNPDGTWGAANKESMTALAVLSFLAHGDTPKSKTYGTHVRKGIMKLAEWGKQSKLPIGIHNKNPEKGTAYTHGLVAYAIAEAYAMTGSYDLINPLNRTIQYICDKQNPNGGFYYAYANNGHSNLSTASYNFQALKAAIAAGCDLQDLPVAINKAISHLKKHATDTGFYYRTNSRNIRAPAMRGVGVLCLQLLGEPNCKEAKRVGDYIAMHDIQHLEWKDNKGVIALYFWYYTTQVLFQRGGDGWNEWNKKFQKILIDNQHPDGYWLSPTRLELNHCGNQLIDNQVYSTTKCALMLTVYYRYLPSSVIKKSGGYKPGKEQKDAATGEEEIDIF
ncbi:hypothetical protein LNTAR_09604 [Lentisphaera araneosa HTCC2155]|uniref:Squalene cyclase C-terminal domain-containing protein n=1 Tax=Lentisphaera araneosa HTCC2155 TaxID=313628 RepID=A6DIG2_9BACT|nr:prenyltransferase/squalene oxidase repeat-containing protein [Lentisphaera araneosa]EDM28816.1 hypothetical protein LNTAR_09604 [Lentisphaera araneosa HTCC2155]